MNGGRAAEARARAQAVGAVLGRADELAPSAIQGVDATGSLRMTLGADGLPVAIEVAVDWARTLGPDRVGAGVAQAFADASTRRMVAWAQALSAAGIGPAADGMSAGSGGQARPRPSPSGRTIDDVTEAMIDAVHRSAAAPDVAAGVGATCDGRLVLTVSPSTGVRCEVDPHWAGSQGAGSLTGALGAAPAAARADLAASVRPARAAQHDLDVLLADAFALLGAAGPGHP